MAVGILDRVTDYLIKVGPKGYIHGWIFVGAPGIGDIIHHSGAGIRPGHGRGTVSHIDDNGHVHVAFDSGARRSFEHVAGDGPSTFGRRKDIGNGDKLTTHMNAARAARRRQDFAAAAEHHNAAAEATTHPAIAADMRARAANDTSRIAQTVTVAKPREIPTSRHEEHMAAAAEAEHRGDRPAALRHLTQASVTAPDRDTQRDIDDRRRELSEQVLHSTAPADSHLAERGLRATNPGDLKVGDVYSPTPAGDLRTVTGVNRTGGIIEVHHSGYTDPVGGSTSTTHMPSRQVYRRAANRGPLGDVSNAPRPVPTSSHEEHVQAANDALARGDRAAALRHLATASNTAPDKDTRAAIAAQRRDVHTQMFPPAAAPAAQDNGPQRINPSDLNIGDTYSTTPSGTPLPVASIDRHAGGFVDVHHDNTGGESSVHGPDQPVYRHTEGTPPAVRTTLGTEPERVPEVSQPAGHPLAAAVEQDRIAENHEIKASQAQTKIREAIARGDMKAIKANEKIKAEHERSARAARAASAKVRATAANPYDRMSDDELNLAAFTATTDGRHAEAAAMHEARAARHRAGDGGWNLDHRGPGGTSGRGHYVLRWGNPDIRGADQGPFASRKAAEEWRNDAYKEIARIEDHRAREAGIKAGTVKPVDLGAQHRESMEAGEHARAAGNEAEAQRHFGDAATLAPDLGSRARANQRLNADSTSHQPLDHISATPPKPAAAMPTSPHEEHLAAAEQALAAGNKAKAINHLMAAANTAPDRATGDRLRSRQMSLAAEMMGKPAPGGTATSYEDLLKLPRDRVADRVAGMSNEEIWDGLASNRHRGAYAGPDNRRAGDALREESKKRGIGLTRPKVPKPVAAPGPEVKHPPIPDVPAGQHNPGLGSFKPEPWVHTSPNLDLPDVDRTGPRSLTGYPISVGDHVSVGKKGERTYRGQNDRAKWTVAGVNQSTGNVNVISQGSPAADHYYRHPSGEFVQRKAIRREWPINEVHHERTVTDQEYERVQNLKDGPNDPRLRAEYEAHDPATRAKLAAQANETSKTMSPWAANHAWTAALDDHNRRERVQTALAPYQGRYSVGYRRDEDGRESYEVKDRSGSSLGFIRPVTDPEAGGSRDSETRDWKTFSHDYYQRYAKTDGQKPGKGFAETLHDAVAPSEEDAGITTPAVPVVPASRSVTDAQREALDIVRRSGEDPRMTVGSFRGAGRPQLQALERQGLVRVKDGHDPSLDGHNPVGSYEITDAGHRLLGTTPKPPGPPISRHEEHMAAGHAARAAGQEGRASNQFRLASVHAENRTERENARAASDRSPTPGMPAADKPAAAPATPAGPMDRFSPQEQATIRNAVADHAGGFYGGPMGFGRSDAARYTSEGHLKDLTNKHDLKSVWQAVDSVIGEDPSVLNRSESERAAGKAERAVRAEAKAKEALGAFQSNDLDRASSLLDEGELIDPAHQYGSTGVRPGRSWDQMRAAVDRRRDANNAPQSAVMTDAERDAAIGRVFDDAPHIDPAASKQAGEAAAQAEATSAPAWVGVGDEHAKSFQAARMETARNAAQLSAARDNEKLMVDHVQRVANDPARSVHDRQAAKDLLGSSTLAENERKTADAVAAHKATENDARLMAASDGLTGYQTETRRLTGELSADQAAGRKLSPIEARERSTRIVAEERGRQADELEGMAAQAEHPAAKAALTARAQDVRNQAKERRYEHSAAHAAMVREQPAKPAAPTGFIDQVRSQSSPSGYAPHDERVARGRALTAGLNEPQTRAVHAATGTSPMGDIREKDRAARYQELSEHDFAALPVEHRQAIRDDLGQIAQSTATQTISGRRTSMGTTIRGVQADHVGEAKRRLADFQDANLPAGPHESARFHRSSSNFPEADQVRELQRRHGGQAVLPGDLKQGDRILVPDGNGGHVEHGVKNVTDRGKIRTDTGALLPVQAAVRVPKGEGRDVVPAVKTPELSAAELDAADKTAAVARLKSKLGPDFTTETADKQKAARAEARREARIPSANDLKQEHPHARAYAEDVQASAAKVAHFDESTRKLQQQLDVIDDELKNGDLRPTTRAHLESVRATGDQRIQENLDELDRAMQDHATARNRWEQTRSVDLASHTDAQLEDRFHRLSTADHPDEVAGKLGDVLDEMGRRETATSEIQNRIDAATARGVPYREAYADAHGLDADKLDRQERAALVDSARRAGESREQAVKRMYAEHVHLQHLAAEADTNGHLLKPGSKTFRDSHGKTIVREPISVFSGPAERARLHASEDLQRWWQDHPRLTYSQFRAEMLGDASDRRTAAQSRLAANGRDFGV